MNQNGNEVDIGRLLVNRILPFDTSEIYTRCTIDRHKRINRFSKEYLFPKRQDGLCHCGCGQKLTGAKYRWATYECQMFAFFVWCIIKGRSEDIKVLLKVLHGNRCAICSKRPTGKPLELDHIIPVGLGGGGCWITNFQLLCHDCHKRKTAKDNIAINDNLTGRA